MTDHELKLDLGPVRLNCKRSEVGAVFAGLLREVRAAAAHLDETERCALRFIMSRPNRTVSVSDVFPDFARNTPAHDALRRLRAAQFVLPVGRDKWKRDTVIETNPFARFLWERFGEPLLFGALGSKPPSADAPTDDGTDPFSTLQDDNSLNDVIAAITAEQRDRQSAE